jgi:hypothetical protein
MKRRGYAYYVQQFLRRYPEVAAALRARDAYVVVFAPERHFEELPSPERVARHTRLALEEAERALPPRPGVPLFVAEGAGCYFYRALLPEHLLGGNEKKEPSAKPPPLVGLRASRGIFVGFVEAGEGGATFYDPNGRHGGWEAAREMVMEQLATLDDGMAR